MVAFDNAAGVLSRKLIEGNVVHLESNPTVGAGTEQILGADPERTHLVIFNLAAGEVFIGFSGAVSSTNGMLLPPNGGFMAMNLLDDLDAVTQPMYAYAAAAAQQLYIYLSRREIKAGG